MAIGSLSLVKAPCFLYSPVMPGFMKVYKRRKKDTMLLHRAFLPPVLFYISFAEDLAKVSL